MNNDKHYNLFTTIAMIVGIVIGSGIFFKADDMLIYTHGNAGLAVIIFIIAAFAIIFGSLCFSKMATMTDKPGGVIAYFDEFMGPRWAAMFGWFQVFAYYPAMVVVLSYVTGIYINIAFNLALGTAGTVLLGMLWFILCFGWNLLSARIGGVFQEIGLIVKLIPLVLLGIAGMIWGDPLETLKNVPPEGTLAVLGFSWIASVGPVAFSFDGWVIATSISHEIRDSKKTMSLAFVVSPLIILIIYIVYFMGISGYLGTENVIAYGDAAVGVFAEELIGPWFGKVIYFFVMISVMATTNGVILGYIRLPYALALRNALPASRLIARMNKKSRIPVNSGIAAFIIGCFWWVVHCFVLHTGVLGNGDICEISIVFSYILYVIIYVQMFRLWRKGIIEGALNGVVFPACATLGSIFIFIGGATSPRVWLFVMISLGISALGYLYGRRAKTLDKMI